MKTFFFTDIENSTRLWEEYGEVMAVALQRHDALLAELIPAFGGRIVKHRGDGVFAVFEGGAPAACALELQRRLRREDWGVVGEIRVRVGLHAGEAEVRDGDYFGPAVNRAARLTEAGWGGQILITPAAIHRVELGPGAELIDLGVHLLQDLGQPEKIFQLTHADLPAREFPALRSLSSRPHNLPPQPTPFIGRERELVEVAALVKDPSCRLVTLLGPGGIGKTRLALQVAAGAAADYEWGVHFVSLAPVRGPEYMVAAVADALKFSFSPGEDPKNQLLTYVGGKSLLLIMDNFEHLAAGTSLLTEILGAGPDVTLLATSRERLNIRAERVYEVGGMTYPSSPPAANWEGFSAVKLFLDSARRVEPSFRLRGADLANVVEICKIVRGLPLAIELATSWLRVLSVEEVAAELGRGLDLLATQAADVPARHRSLAAVFDYSYELLSERERRIVAALSIFEGSFGREAAQEVAGAGLPGLTALVDKSLVRRLSEGRFELHGLVRQYARTKLAEEAEGEAEARRRYAAYFLSVLTSREEALAGVRQQEALAEIAVEIDNVRAAWEYAVERLDSRAIADAAEPLFAFYRMRGLFGEGCRVFGRALAAFEAVTAAGGGGEDLKTAYVKLLVGTGNFENQVAHYEKGAVILRRAVAEARRRGAWREVIVALNGLASGAFYGGDRARARRTSRAVLRLSEKINDNSEIVPALLNLAFCAKAEADYAGAKAFYTRALEAAQESGDQNRAAIILNNMANVERALGNTAEAKELLEYSLEAGREVGNRRLVSFALNNLGNLAEQRGDLEEAVRCFRESLDIKKELNDRRQMSDTLANLGGALSRLGDYEQALKRCAEGVSVAREIGLPAKAASCLERMGRILLAQGDYGKARDVFAEGFRAAIGGRDFIPAVPLLIGLAVSFAKTGEPERGVEALAALIKNPPVPTSAGEAAKELAVWEKEMEASRFAAAVARGRGRDWLAVAEDLIEGGGN